MTGISDSSSGESGDSARRLFPDTLWSLVGDASWGDPDKSAAALRQLCMIYREPIVGRLLSQGYGQDAEDLASGFVEFLLERNRLENFVRGEVKFRSFLLKCLKGFLRDQWRSRVAAKRGGGEVPVSIDELELGREEELDVILDRQFALTVHRRTVERLASEHATGSESARFARLKAYLLGGDGAMSYADLGAELGMTVNNVKVSVLRLRRRYAEYFHEDVLQTVARDAADAEMRYLISLLANTEAATGS